MLTKSSGSVKDSQIDHRRQTRARTMACKSSLISNDKKKPSGIQSDLRDEA